MLLLPSPSNCWPIVKDSPWMIDTIATTEATPMMMPSVVRKLRNPCARIACSAARTPSTAANSVGKRATVSRRARPRPPAPLTRRVSALVDIVLHDLAVAQPDHALAVLGHLGLVRDDDDGLPVGVQLVE